jgi:peptidoglycan/xylan/chitin deacetylase (PgdA/CDA1 family)
MTELRPLPDWLAEGKRAAVCFTIDDVHPGRSTDLYEAGGDLGRGALRHLEWLLGTYPQLRTTIFATADWRETSPVPTRKVLARTPLLCGKLPLAPRLPKDTMRLDRHPAFASYLRELPRTEVALHGLHHFSRGHRISAEFADLSRAGCAAALRKALQIFRQAGLEPARGLCPPGWDASPALLDAMVEVGLAYVASARDIVTAVSRTALTSMSGLRGQPLIKPAWVRGRILLHIPTNFQATSPIERADAIVEQGGLLSIKAHIVKNAAGVVSLDGLDEEYAGKLDRLFSHLDNRYGNDLDWTSMGEIQARAFAKAL